MRCKSSLKNSGHFARHHWFPHDMTSEKRAQKFHTNDVSLPRSGKCVWLVEAYLQPIRSTTPISRWLHLLNHSSQTTPIHDLLLHLRNTARRRNLEKSVLSNRHSESSGNHSRLFTQLIYSCFSCYHVSIDSVTSPSFRYITTHNLHSLICSYWGLGRENVSFSLASLSRQLRWKKEHCVTSQPAWQK